jgi:hypothetical protein
LKSKCLSDNRHSPNHQLVTFLDITLRFSDIHHTVSGLPKTPDTMQQANAAIEARRGPESTRQPQSQLDLLSINTIRTLSMDAVQKANSGHPGTPMALAPVAYVLWERFLRHNPRNPDWPNRDRFVLSAGHASMLLYSLLHLAGYDLSLNDIQQFRQFGSKTPGHPERGLTPGVEATTGPAAISSTIGSMPSAPTAILRKESRTRPPRSPDTSASPISSGSTTTTTSASRATPRSPTTTT